MILAQISFKIREDLGEEAREGAVYQLLGSWHQNGQILGREHRFTETKGRVLLFEQLPAADALSPVHDNQYVKRSKKALKEAGLSGPRVTVLGSAEPTSHGDHEPQSYLFYTNYVSDTSPLCCGECLEPLPLYTIPPTNDDSDYYHITAWISDYQACDTLQMNCATGERFAIREMSDPNSSLSRRGREHCAQIERLTGKPTYYFLYRYVRGVTLAKERARPCPVCGGDWLLPEKWHFFDFRCDACRLVSTISYTIESLRGSANRSPWCKLSPC